MILTDVTRGTCVALRTLFVFTQLSDSGKMRQVRVARFLTKDAARGQEEGSHGG